MTEQLLARARNGDGDAFAELIAPFRHELQVHCYRVLGSTADAEDLLQETMMAAWRGLDRFEERASLRGPRSRTRTGCSCSPSTVIASAPSPASWTTASCRPSGCRGRSRGRKTATWQHTVHAR